MNDTTPPNDKQAEQAVLGAAMLLPAAAIPDDVLSLNGTDFYQPAHEWVWDAILELAARGAPADVITVAALLAERDQLKRLGGAPYLHTLVASPAAAVNASYYAAIVRDKAIRRNAITACQQSLQELYQSEDDAVTVLERAEERLAATPDTQTDDLGSMLSFQDFLRQSLPPEEWVIPGLLSRGDRLILTGNEGLGKTTLVRQIATCVAAGVQPFTGAVYPARTVLYVDCENPNRLMMNRFQAMADAIALHRREVLPGRLWIDRRPDGLDLVHNPAEVRWLRRRLEKVKPDVLVIGPIYKLHNGTERGEADETQARKLSATLDRLREEFDCALILEAHSPKGESGQTRPVTPIGSSLWLRWPEFGYGLRPVPRKDVPVVQAEKERLCEFVAWKKRDERDWPRHLMSSGSMPWVETVV